MHKVLKTTSERERERERESNTEVQSPAVTA